MSEKIEVLDPCTSPEWMRFVSQHPDAGIFHHPGWLQIIRDTYGYHMFAVCAFENGGITAGIPFADVRSTITGNRWISLPFSDNCKPLLPTDTSNVLKLLSEFFAKNLARETARIEIHGDFPFQGQTVQQRTYVQHTLNLPSDETALFDIFNKKSTQYSIRNADRKGVVVKECRSWEQFEPFYDLQLKTRRRLGVPLQPKALFEGVWKNLVQPGLGYALLACKDEVPLAGGVFLKFNDLIHFKYSASDMTYASLRPTHALIWAGLQKAMSLRCTRVEFGRSEKTNAGLRRFKSSWGASEEDLNYSVMTNHRPVPNFSAVDGILKQVIRLSPSFVCQLSGEVLYRHFA